MNPNHLTISESDATPDAAEIGGVEQSVDSATHSMIEQISAMYRDYNRRIATRDEKRIEFNDNVRICPANAKGVPCGPSTIVRARDLSLWGISILSPQPIERDTCLVLEFTLPNGVDHVVTMLGQVRHSHSEDDVQVIGCEFTATLSD